MSDSDNIESVINTDHTATEAPNLSEIHTSQYSNPPIQISPSMNSVNVINTDNGEIVNTSNNSNIAEDGNLMEASNINVENAVPNNNLNNTVLGDQNNVTQKNVSAMNDTTSVMPINHNFSRATEASAATSKSNVSGIGNVALNVSTMGGNANINPVGGYNGIQLDSSQNLQQIQANNIGSINVTQPTGADLIHQHQILILNALQQQHLQMQKPKVQQNDSSSQNQNIQNNQLQAQLLNSLVSHQPQMNQLLFHNPILFNALHSGNNNPVGIPPLPPPHPGHSSIGLQPFPVHPLLLPAVLHAQQQQQKQQTSQETQQLINSTHNPTIQTTQVETSADDNPTSKVAAISEAGNNGINLNPKMTNSPKVEIQTTNITSENITNKTEPAKNIDLANSSPNMNPRDSGGLKMPSPSLIHNINQLPPTILPLPQPHQGMRFPQPGITGQNNLINPFFMLQRMVSPNSLYMGFNPQLGMTTNNSSNNNNTSNSAGNSSVSNGNNASGSATVAAQPGILPNSGHLQIPNIPLLPPQGLLAAAAGIPSQQIPQVLNFINNGGGIMNNGEFFGQNILGGIANLSGIGGNFLMENDLERLHNHAESLVKTLLETSVPKAGVKLRLEWDKKRYCFKFTVYQVEEVTDSLGFQKKRMIPIDQDELFVNVNASKQLNIENIEKAMWSAFVSVRHTLAKYCDRQAGQRRQTSASVSTTGATSLSRGLVQNNLTKMEDNNNSMIIGGGTGGKIKGYKKDELNINNLLDKKYLQGATNEDLISLNLAGAINGKSSYKADPYNTGNSSGVGSATVHGNTNIGGNGRGKRGYAGTTTRSGRFVSLKYGYDDLMLSDDEGTMGGEQEYVGRKGRKPKYSNVNIAVGGGSSSGEDNNINGVISNNISSTNNRYAKTYITNRGRRGSGHSSNSNSGLGIYKTRGSGLSSDIYNNHDSITVTTSNSPIFVLQKDEPGKKHSLVGLYAEWVDKHTIWDPRKGPLKTVFVSESFNKEDFNNDKRDILRFTTNNYIKWDPSHIITDLRSIHIPISMAGEYFGLLRKERTNNNDEESNNKGYLVKNNSDSVDEIDCDNKTNNNNNNDSENHNNKNVKESNTVTPITIKGNNVPNANQIRFVSNNEKYRNLLSIFNNSNDNMSSMSSDANEKYLEEKLFELETVDSVLVSTIQTTAALEQRKKKENKNSLATTIPTGSFLTSVFSHNHSNNNDNSDSTNEEDNLIGGSDRITINSNMYNSDDNLININNEEIQEYKHLILRFMHQQNGDDDFTLENNNNNSMLIDSNTENKDNTGQSFDSNNNVNSISKNGNRLASRGLKRRGTMRNGSIVDNDQIQNLNNLQSSSSNSQSALFNNDDNTEIRNNHPNAMSSISNSSYNSNNYNQVPNNGLTVTGTNEEGINFNSGMFGSGAIAASAMLESLITSVRGNSSDKYRQQQMLQAYPQNRFVSKKKCKETNEILAKYVNDLANEYCNRNFGSSNLADGYVNAFNSHVLKNCNKQ